MKSINDFIGMYPLSKTLRFELIPQGKTAETFSKWVEELSLNSANELRATPNLLAQDENRAQSYIKVKKILDEYHKWFISESLKDTKLENLEEYFLYYHLPRKEQFEKDGFNKCQDNLRKQIVKAFKQEPALFNKLSGKELFKDTKEEIALLKTIIPFFNAKTLEHINVTTTEEALQLVDEFKDFTTYFTGFHKNRENMYSEEEKSTAIAFRLIHENLPRFIDNLNAFSKIKNSEVKDKFPLLLKDLESILQTTNIEGMFMLDYFNDTLTQTGIDIYNHLIGGYSEEGKKKIQGLNEYVNLYNQQQKDKSKRLPKLKPLYKQILSDRQTASFVIDAFENDNEVLGNIKILQMQLHDEVFAPNTKMGLGNLLSQIGDSNTNKIFLKNDLGLTNVSKQVYGNWAAIEEAWNKHYDDQQKKVKETEDYIEKRKKVFNATKSFSILQIEEMVNALNYENYQGKSIVSYFANSGKIEEKPSLFKQIETNYSSLNELINTTYDKNKNLSQQEKDVEKIKTYLDSVKELQHFIKPLLGSGEESDKDEQFYGEFTPLWDALDVITPLYNKVRNYMTKKPYSDEKFKLNFENSTLMDGWDANKEEANSCILFEKSGLFYIGIMPKEHNKIFRNIPKSKSDNFYNKVVYKLLPGASKMLPKVFFGGKNIDFFNPSEDILRIRNHGSHTKNGKAQENYEKHDFKIQDCHAMIDFYKNSINIHKEWKNFGFEFQHTSNYQSIDEFYREVENQGYNLSYVQIDDDSIHQLVNENKLYLFQIYNKDFSPNSKGTPNLHTMYWKMLFNPENLKDVVFKLNGQAEVFYRKASIKDESKIIHKANQPIQNKNDLNKKKQSVFEYDLIKDKRYTLDKFQFHVPITINFKAKSANNLSEKVNEFIKKSDELHIIGIDRGERHLLYLSLIDMQGKIVKQFTLNEIINEYQGNTYKTNYHDLLDKKEGSRDDARKSWRKIENIKELKEGYLSQVIHKIAQLMIEYNAIVVMEDLNFGFKRGRFKVEKQVYQKFEKMLIDKLNFLADKKNEASEPGGILKAYQLTDSYADFMKYKKKQCGFLFYVPAWNTSKMDPTTGFVSLFDTRYVNTAKSQEFFGKFKDIRFNSNKDYFEFEVEKYSDFASQAEDTRQDWIICTHGNRIITFRNSEKNGEWDNKEVILTKEFTELFEKYNIDYKKANLKKLIMSQTDKNFFDSLLKLFKLTLQMRNSKTGTDIDYLISPVANSQGAFFDSRRVDKTLPENADANGAFNIARKGQWVIEQIKKADDLKKVKLAISNKEWLQFVQGK